MLATYMQRLRIKNLEIRMQATLVARNEASLLSS